MSLCRPRSTLPCRGVLDSEDGPLPDHRRIDGVPVGEGEGEICCQGRGRDVDMPQCNPRFSTVDGASGPLCMELFCQSGTH